MTAQLLASTADLAEGEFVTTEVDGTEIIVGKADGRYFAVEDLCPHAYVNISYGSLEGCELTCPWHGYSFDVHSGECLTGLESEQLTTLPVEERGGGIYLKQAPDAP